MSQLEGCSRCRQCSESEISFVSLRCYPLHGKHLHSIGSKQEPQRFNGETQVVRLKTEPDEPCLSSGLHDCRFNPLSGLATRVSKFSPLANFHCVPMPFKRQWRRSVVFCLGRGPGKSDQVNQSSSPRERHTLHCFQTRLENPTVEFLPGMQAVHHSKMGGGCL